MHVLIRKLMDDGRDVYSGFRSCQLAHVPGQLITSLLPVRIQQCCAQCLQPFRSALVVSDEHGCATLHEVQRVESLVVTSCEWIRNQHCSRANSGQFEHRPPGATDYHVSRRQQRRHVITVLDQSIPAVRGFPCCEISVVASTNDVHDVHVMLTDSKICGGSPGSEGSFIHASGAT